MKPMENNVNGGGQKSSLNSYFQDQISLAYALHTKNTCVKHRPFCVQNLNVFKRLKPLFKKKEEEYEKMKKKNAISLIVLVITVIVMAILAATVIITLSNTNIISEANNAVKKTEAQQVEEIKALMLADGMLGKNPESQTIGSTTLTWNNTEKKVEAKVEGVLIPEGFSYVEGTKDTGLVIEDKEQNQFVWVPVEYTATGTEDENGLDTGFTAVFKRGLAEETSTGSGIYKMTGTLGLPYIEPFRGYVTEIEEYYAMMESVQKYNGFYIARFEAGDGEATAERTATTEAHKVVSKKGAYVYNYVPWGDSMTEIGITGAVYLSQNMYKESTSVVSTLCYGVQWDAVMNFVSDANHNIENSESWGNYSNSRGEAAINSGTSNMNYTTGRNEAWKAKNIYDLAGNVDEWTMERTYTKSNRRVCRGGSVYYFSASQPASNRISPEPADTNKEYGFRVALYIK